MKKVPDAKLLLVLPEISFHVKIMKIRETPPASLTFQRIATLADYPSLSLETPPNLTALLFPSADNSTGEQLYNSLHLQFNVDLCTNPVIELEDSDNMMDIYIIACSNDRGGLGRFIKGATLALFRFNTTDLFAERVDLLSLYAQHLKNTKFSLLKQYQCLSDQLQQTKYNTTYYSDLLESYKAKNKNIKEEFELANSAVAQLKLQLDNLRRRHSETHSADFLCTLCEEAPRTVIMLPCYHLVACNRCVMTKMEIPLNELLHDSTPIYCAFCNIRVDLVTEVLLT